MGNNIGHILCHPVFRIVFNHIFQKYGCEGTDSVNMVPGLHAPELHDGSQRIDDMVIHLRQFPILFLDFLRLLLHHRFQVILMMVQIYQIAHTPSYNGYFKRFGYNIGHSQIISSFPGFAGGITGNQYHRNRHHEMLFMHIIQYSETVHLRHDNIQQYCGKLTTVAVYIFYCLPAIFRQDYLIILFEDTFKYLPVHLHVINNKYPIFHVSIPFPQTPLYPRAD